jgi:predicted metal-binding membrane protein
MAHGDGIASGHGWSGDSLWICTIGLGNGAGGGGHAATSGGVDSVSLLAATPAWGLMALAMMVPAALPAMRHVACTSLYWRRRRAAAEFLAVFVGLWTAFGVLVLFPLSSWEATRSPLLPAAALAAAALWQLTPLKHRALLACHRSRPIPPRGWRASAGTSTFALYNGGACLASCWAMMVAASLAGPGRLWWMGAMAGAMTVEKLAEKPRWIARRLAALLAAAAVGVALAAML